MVLTGMRRSTPPITNAEVLRGEWAACRCGLAPAPPSMSATKSPPFKIN